MRRKTQSWLSWLWAITNRHLMGLPADIFSLNDGDRHVDITRHAWYVILVKHDDLDGCIKLCAHSSSLRFTYFTACLLFELYYPCFVPLLRTLSIHVPSYRFIQDDASYSVPSSLGASCEWERWELQDGCKLCIYSRADAASAQIENLKLICPTPSAPLNSTSNGIRCPMLELQ